MDISIIDASKVKRDLGLVIGDPNAPKTIVEFINVRCPYSKEWFEKSKETLDGYIANGKVKRVIKLFDKEKESLQRGNIAHHYLPLDNSQKSYDLITELFKTQETWKDFTLEEVATYMEETFNLTDVSDQVAIDAIINEANAAHIQFVPTVIVDDHIFDESIDMTTLKSYLVD
ncbi:DsbA family protein [Dellaglioa algida]|uniref:DsbA family protein n=1 Tax=Dellaglioa algida TaxID=105612 RepID=UPI0024C4BB4B|nr:DsbA family protein [Dellaglioa algida]MDK1725980.1 DsbA family protein [Dellaglioa algida]